MGICIQMLEVEFLDCHKTNYCTDLRFLKVKWKWFVRVWNRVILCLSININIPAQLLKYFRHLKFSALKFFLIKKKNNSLKIRFCKYKPSYPEFWYEICTTQMNWITLYKCQISYNVLSRTNTHIKKGKDKPLATTLYNLKLIALGWIHIRQSYSILFGRWSAELL